MRRSSLVGGHSRPKVGSSDLALLEDISITPPTSYASAEVFAEDRATLNGCLRGSQHPEPGKVDGNLNTAMITPPTTPKESQAVDSKRPDVVAVSFSEDDFGSEGDSFEISIVAQEKVEPEAGIKTSPTIQPIILETPANLPLLIDIKMEMPVVSYIQPASPLAGHVGKGDIIVFVDGKSTAEMSHMLLTRLLNKARPAQTGKRKLVILPSKHGRDILKNSQGEDGESSSKRTDIIHREPSPSRQVTPEKECHENDSCDKASLQQQDNQTVEDRDVILQAPPPLQPNLSVKQFTTISSNPLQHQSSQPVASPDNDLARMRRSRSMPSMMEVEDSGTQQPGIAQIADDEARSIKSETILSRVVIPSGDDRKDEVDVGTAKDDSNEPQQRNSTAEPQSGGRQTSFQSSADGGPVSSSMSTRYLSCQSRQKACESHKTEPVGGEPAVISDDEPPEQDPGEESNVNRELGPIESSHDAPNEETPVRPQHTPPSTPVPVVEEQDRKGQGNGHGNNDNNDVDEQDSKDRERAERRNRAAPNIEFIQVDDSSSRACDLSTIYGGRWDPACHTAHRVEDTLGYMEQVSVFYLHLSAPLNFQA